MHPAQFRIAVVSLCVFAALATAQEPTPTSFGETIEVRRIVTEVRVVAYLSLIHI